MYVLTYKIFSKCNRGHVTFNKTSNIIMFLYTYIFFVNYLDIRVAIYLLMFSNRLPKVAFLQLVGRASSGYVPLVTRLSPRKVVVRPRHFLLYNRCQSAPLGGMRHPKWRWRHAANRNDSPNLSIDRSTNTLWTLYGYQSFVNKKSEFV